MQMVGVGPRRITVDLLLPILECPIGACHGEGGRRFHEKSLITPKGRRRHSGRRQQHRNPRSIDIGRGVRRSNILVLGEATSLGDVPTGGPSRSRLRDLAGTLPS